MGKSPGKWIKTVLFGKKTSRSSLPKPRYTSKAANEKETWLAAKEPTTDLPVDQPLVSEPTTGPTDGNGGNLASEKGVTSNLPREEDTLLPEMQDTDKQITAVFGALNDPDRIRLEQAATKAQAAFRGYLARRAFRALGGIIRLQALVRGHLVRRQAVATLRCMQSIIKFQALVRGRRFKLSDADPEMHRKCSLGKPLDAKCLDSAKVNASVRTEKLQANALFCNLLRSSPTAKPLRLQYALEEPNSARNWLERWSSSRFWEPLPPPKKNIDLKSQTRQGGFQSVETGPSRSKRTIRRGPAAHVDNGSINLNSETEKPKRNLRKASSHPVDPVQEHPHNELEKVKRNLRKVLNPMVESTDRLDVEAEKPRRSLRKASTSPAPAIADKGTCESSEKMKDITVAVSKDPGSDASLPVKPLVAEDSVDILHESHSPVELPSLESIEQEKSNPVANGEPISNKDHTSKEDPTSNENHKTSRRRSSFPAKQENPENGLQKTPTLPSYMATTESAKAKLRGQSSPRFGQDGAETNGFTRRHSLPSSTNSKLSSLSPRPQRLVQASGKGGIKNDRSLLSSRDGSEKVVQAEWKR